jgi:uncharacterized protein YbjQ (UPF0145 family)
MILTTREILEGYEITETLGVVRGNTVRVRHLGNDIVASLKNLVGGEIMEYTELMADAREQAIDRMVVDAQERGANGIVCIRFMTSMVMRGASEILAYGTAVRLRKIS